MLTKFWLYRLHEVWTSAYCYQSEFVTDRRLTCVAKRQLQEKNTQTQSYSWVTQLLGNYCKVRNDISLAGFGWNLLRWIDPVL